MAIGIPLKSIVIAIYPGSFDPITNGHLDLIERGSRLVDRLIVSILRNEAKQPLFTVEERMEMLREVVQRLSECRGGFVRRAAGGLRARRNRPPSCCAAFAPFRITSTSCRWR